MNSFFAGLKFKKRCDKPRLSGITMVLDKSLGLNETDDLLKTAAPFIDIIKFGWGTCALYPDDILKKKIQLFKNEAINVCLGGTFMEIAFEHGKLDEALLIAKDFGINMIEVSNGIHQTMTHKEKLGIIEKTLSMGFITISEVGKKMIQEDSNMTCSQRITEIKDDIAAGVFKVIMESRETGNVGIFKPDGKINYEVAYELFQSVDPDKVIWEAPQKEQQVWLMHQLGPDVNIGNVPTGDIISLESLRHGLRADTFRDHQKNSILVYLELGVGGALRAKRRGDVVVVVDALRVSSTIIQCLGQGAIEIFPVTSADELVGEITIGERGGAKIPTADFGNSPKEISKIDLVGKSITITSTNGTECIRTAKGTNNTVFIGTLANCSAVASASSILARKKGCNITLLAAGRNNLPALEDRIGVTEILKYIENSIVRGTLEPYYSNNFERDFFSSDSGINLVTLGYADDVLLCSQMNYTDIVPVFDGERILKYNQ